MFDTSTLTETQVTEIVNSYKDGKATLTSLASQLGCSIPTVGRLLKKNGVQMRGKGRPKGSKTVNRKPKVAATNTNNAAVASAPSAEGNVENLAASADTSNFAAFQQKVMQFTKPA